MRATVLFGISLLGDEKNDNLLIGLAILIIGGFLYGSFVERIFKPDDRQTPAVKLEDGVDYVPMSKWKMH